MANRKDLARIIYILDNYDDIEVATYASGEFDTSAEFRNSNNTPAKMVVLSKKINGTYYVAQAVPETAYKKLWVVSAYIKSGELTQVPDNSGGYLASRSTANNIIPDSTEKSNTKIKESDRDTAYLDAVESGNISKAQVMAEDRGYSADIIVGTTKSGVRVLYDLVGLEDKK